MFGFEPIIVAGMACAIFIGGIVKGITGIGLPVVTMVIVVNFISPKTALALVIISIVVTNAWQAFRNPAELSSVKRFWPVMIPFIVCLYIGSTIVRDIDATTMFAAMGGAVLVFAGAELWKPRSRPLGQMAERLLGPVAGAIGGLLGGISTIWGPPIMMFLFMLQLPKDDWVRTIGLLWMIGAVPLAIFYFANGVLNAETLPLSISAVVPGMVGILVGERLRRMVNEYLFRKILLFALLVIGLNLLRRALV